MQSTSIRSAYLILSGLAMTLPTTALAAGEKSATGLEEVTVTARRREESAQETPVAVSVLTAEQLYTAGIKEVRDLTTAVPGVNMTSSGGGNNTVFSIRGRSRSVIGNVQPSATAYVNEVPLSPWGASIPTYDVSSVQVLKGPQGTLFGRNSTTGAVLVSTTRPTYNLEGYLQATLGNYQYQQYEGALNVPLLQDKVALRVAGQFTDRNGYTKNMSGGKDFDDLNRDNYRASLLIDPFEGFSNLTIYERNDQDETGPGIVLGDHYGGVVDTVPYYNGQFLGFLPSAPFVIPCNGNPMCDISAATARQNAAGPRKVWTSQGDTYIKGKMTSWSNTTTWDVGPVTLKNIFGYREVYFRNFGTDIDGTDMPMIDTDNITDIQQTTDEFQLSGKALDDNLNYIAGYFYSDGAPSGPNRLSLQLFAAPGATMFSPLGVPYNGAYGFGGYYHDTSKAVFAQVDYKLGGLSESLSKFSVDLGVRNTKDEQSVCNAGNPTPAGIVPQFIGQDIITESQCKAGAGTQSKTDSQKTTYTFGINYQAADNVLIYGVTRTGYRAGGINTPKLADSFAQYQTYEPETVQDFELGLKSEWTVADMPGRFNVAVFDSKFDKIQAGIAIAPNLDGDNNPNNDPANSNLLINAGKASVKGVEAEASLLPIDRLELSVSGAYLDNQIDSLDTPFPASEADIKSFVFLASPRYSYTLGAAYTLPLADLGDLRFNAKYFRISDVQYGTVLSHAYELTDLRVDWLNIAQSGIDVGAYINNVFDKAAIVAPASSSSGLGTNSGMYNEPRMYGVQARYHFGKK